MSLLLNQPSFCVPKPVSVRSSPLFSNNAFSTSLRQIICVDPCRPNLGRVGHTRLDGITVTPNAHKVPKEEMVLPQQIIFVNPYRPNLGRYVHAKLNGITVTNRVNKVTKWNLLDKKGMIVSSNGRQVFLYDGLVRFRENPSTLFPLDDDWKISLPPLVTLPLCQTQMFTNVAMSSSSPKEEDCVVAIKFFGPQLSFCKPAQRKPEWINVRIEKPSFFSSPIMFSKKDEMFHIVGSGGHLIGSWDLREHKTKFRKLQFHNLPEISKTKRKLLDSCCTSEHLVESQSTDETFMVKWYKKTKEDDIESMETKAVMVFKVDEEGNAVYTQAIGDLIIFLTKPEIFCVPACFFPKMRPNCVQIWDVDDKHNYRSRCSRVELLKSRFLSFSGQPIDLNQN